jgi:hypothetical protein
MSMKALIQAIQTSLKNAAGLSYVADADIFITPDENIIPIGCAFPAIGLKDGPIAMSKEATSSGTQLLWEVLYRVNVIIYVDMAAGEAPIVGRTTPAFNGVLDINDAVRTVLHENYQSITGIIDAYCIEENESETIGGNDMILQRKRMTFEYQALESL